MKEMILAVGVEDYTIKYFRTQGELICQVNGEATNVFGILATKYINDQEKESMDAGFISQDINYVNEIINLLGKNIVTPVVLCEIIDEIISQLQWIDDTAQPLFS